MEGLALSGDMADSGKDEVWGGSNAVVSRHGAGHVKYICQRVRDDLVGVRIATAGRQYLRMQSGETRSFSSSLGSLPRDFMPLLS